MFVDVCCIYALYIPKINVPVFLKQTQESEPYSAFVVFFMSFGMLPHNFQDSVMPNVLSRCFWNHPTRLWRKDMTKCLKSRDLHFGVPFSHFDLAPPNGVYLSLGEGFSNINSQRAYPNSKQIDTSSLYPMNLWRSLEVWGSYGSFPQQAPTSPCPWTTHDCWWMTLTPRTWHFYSTQRIFRPQLQCKTLKNPLKELRGFASFKLHMWTYDVIWVPHSKIGHFEEKAPEQRGGCFGGRFLTRRW